MPLLAADDLILVLAELRAEDGGVCRTTLEMLTAARRVGEPIVLVCGEVTQAVATLLGRYGARGVVGGVSEDALLDAVSDLAERLRPEVVMMTAHPARTELAARAAVRLESGIVTDAAELCREGGELRVIQESAGGRYRVESVISRTAVVVTLRPGAVEPRAAQPVEDSMPEIEYTAGENTAVGSAPGESAAAPRRPRVHTRTAKCAADRALLTAADVVVAGGRGVGSAEGFSLLARVARALGGSLGGTHTATELGWCPGHARINLPGAQIRPRLYLAGGVSGSLRHRAAIRGARTVVAIDRDPNAPILREADLAIVGDLHAVLPALLEELAARERAGNPDPGPDPGPDPDPGTSGTPAGAPTSEQHPDPAEA